MNRRRIYGFLAAILCGTAIYLSGYVQGENKRHIVDAESYSQGYKTGYIKAFREFKRQLISQGQVNAASKVGLNK